jgi:hypothetical protein
MTLHEEKMELLGLIADNKRALDRIKWAREELEAKEDALKEWEEDIQKQYDSVERQYTHQTALKATLEAKAEAIRLANVDPIALIDEILLELELEQDPKKIVEYVRKKRQALDIKW